MSGVTNCIVGSSLKELCEKIANISYPDPFYFDSQIEIYNVYAELLHNRTSVTKDDKTGKIKINWPWEKMEVKETDWFATYHLSD